jgi:hypothetical protein
METVMGRLIEIKNEIVAIDLKNYQTYDELFVDIKLIPNDFTIPVPATSSKLSAFTAFYLMIPLLKFIIW